MFTYWFLSYYRAKARAPKHKVICGEARRKERIAAKARAPKHEVICGEARRFVLNLIRQNVIVHHKSISNIRHL